MCLVGQSCPTLCDPMDWSPPGSSVHEILQARILEWVAMPSSRGSSQPRDGTQVSRTAGGFFTIWATRGAPPNIHMWHSDITTLWVLFIFQKYVARHFMCNNCYYFLSIYLVPRDTLSSYLINVPIQSSQLPYRKSVYSLDKYIVSFYYMPDSEQNR